MKYFRFQIGDEVALKGSGLAGVVRERLVSEDTDTLYYGVQDQFNQPVVLVSEVMLYSIDEAIRSAQARDDMKAELLAAAFEKKRAARKAADQ